MPDSSDVFDSPPAISDGMAKKKNLAGMPALSKLPRRSGCQNQNVRLKNLSPSKLPVILAGSFAIMGGCGTLMGWLLNVPRLTDWAATGISMMPNAAVCAVSAGMALVLLTSGRLHGLVRMFSIFTASVGAATFFEFLADTDLGIDRLLLARDWGQRATVAPGRMGLPASASWTLLGLSLALATGGRKARGFAIAVALATAGIAMLSVVGYCFGAEPLFTIPRLTAIAFQTATIVLALAFGVIIALPGHEPMKTLMERTTSSSLARRALPLVFLVPILIGWLRIAGQKAGLFDLAFGTALRTLVEIALLLILVWWTLRKAAGAENALREAKDLAESASQAKDNFLAQLSHELRTPLTPVLITASALRHDGRLPSDIKEDLAMVERNVQLEARLIDDLLDLTRITRGSLTLRAEQCDAHVLIGLAVDIVRDEALEKQVTLSLDLKAESTRLSGDPARLQQVFWNVLRNAVKFTPAGGHISISSHNEVSSAGDVDAFHRVCIVVKDNGVGFNPAASERLFEPFHQLEVNPNAGLGLGLAIARAIIDLHDGFISAESAGPGKGATFTIALPANEIVVEQTSLKSGPEHSEKEVDTPLRLLLVEDHQETLQVLSRLLRRTGHSVCTASSIAGARDAASAETFDLVISDLGLPDGTGHELMEHLRATHGLRGIALSGYGMDEDLRRSAEAGFVAHLVKPVNISDLRRVLRGIP